MGWGRGAGWFADFEAGPGAVVGAAVGAFGLDARGGEGRWDALGDLGAVFVEVGFFVIVGREAAEAVKWPVRGSCPGVEAIIRSQAGRWAGG